MTKKELESLFFFRIQSQPLTNGLDLQKLQDRIFQLSEGLQKDVALIEYERRCLEGWNELLRELKSVGYKEVEVQLHNSITSTLYASPKVEPESNPPLWTYCKKYFPVHTSRGSGADYSFQVLEITFPESLVGKHTL